MSVLSFPRIYFSGCMCWDPATGNNNDYFPTYDDAQAALNWPFLQPLGIDQSNYRTTFRPWAISMQTIDGTKGIPGEWNYFGGNGCYFVQYVDKAKDIDRRTLVSGGALALGQRVDSDPLLGLPATLLGDPFGDPGPRPPGRLVDVNPVSVYSSQIYYNSMAFGDATTGIQAQRAYRMQSRFINFKRNLDLPSAGVASVTWQASFPAGPGLKLNVGQSKLLAALQAQISAGRAKGIMVRFNTYLNLYYQNGFFNDVKPQPASLDELPPLYKAALETGNLFSNPCYSRVVGVIGPWYDDELATAPEGRYLSAPTNIVLCNPRAPSPCWDSAPPPQSADKGGPMVTGQGASAGKNPIRVPPASPQPAAQLGIALAEVDYDRNVISIDVLNTFPEASWRGDKVDFGDIVIGVQNQDAFIAVATLPYATYGQHNYETDGGIVDLPFDPSLAQAIRDGLLVFQVQPNVWVAEQIGRRTFKQVASRSVMVELPLAAQTDQRGVYLNESGRGEVAVSVKLKGKPAPGASILVVKYNPPDAQGGPTTPIPESGPQVVNIVNGQSQVITIELAPGQSVQTVATTVVTDAKGNANLVLQAASPGFPVLAFYPYLPGQTPPPPLGMFNEALTAMFTSIRVLSFDDAFVDQFVQLWNSTFDPAKAWDFVYDNILYLYDMIFPVMLKFVPLNDRRRVEGAIDQVLALVAPSYFPESTLAMPITRDLSQGKRTVLELWGGLVKKNYPPQPIARPGAAMV